MTFNLASLIRFFDGVFKPFPHLSSPKRKFLTRYLPWVGLVIGTFGLMMSLAAVGIVTVFSPVIVLGGGLGIAVSSVLNGIVSLIASVIMIFATPSLLLKKYHGWKMIFLSLVLQLVSAVLSFSVTTTLMVVLGLYLLFEIQSNFKKK